MHYKQQVALKYAEMVYYGQWFSPLREALDAFVTCHAAERHRHGAAQALQGPVHGGGRDEPQQPVPANLASFKMGSEYNPTDATASSGCSACR